MRAFMLFIFSAWLGCCFLMGCLCWLTTQKQFLFLPPALLFLSPNILIITVFFFFLNHLVLIHVIFFTLALSHTPATLNLLCSLFDFSHGNKVLCIQLLYVDFFPLVSKCFCFFFFFFLMRPISATSEGLIYPEELNFLPVCDN